MENFEFYNPVRIVFGPGEVKRTGQEAAALGRKALLVSYKEHDFFAELLADIQKMLQKEGLEVVPFYEVTANPTVAEVRTGTQLCKEAGADLVIGVGGGSAMDAAKIIAAALFLYHRIINLASGCIIFTGHVFVDKTLIVTQVKVCFSTIVGNVNFTMLKRTERTRIDIDVWVQL